MPTVGATAVAVSVVTAAVAAATDDWRLRQLWQLWLLLKKLKSDSSFLCF